MAIEYVQGSKKLAETLQKLHDTLVDQKITSGEAFDTVVRLLGIVLINAIDEKRDCLTAANGLLPDLIEFIHANWDLAEESKQAAKNSPGIVSNRRH